MKRDQRHLRYPASRLVLLPKLPCIGCCQAPIDYMLRGRLNGEDVGLELIKGYHLLQLKLEILALNCL